MKHLKKYKVFEMVDENINIIRDILSYISDDEFNINIHHNSPGDGYQNSKQNRYLIYIFKSIENGIYNTFDIDETIINGIMELHNHFNSNVIVTLNSMTGSFISRDEIETLYRNKKYDIKDIGLITINLLLDPPTFLPLNYLELPKHKEMANEAWMSPVVKLDLDGKYIREYECIGDAAKDCEISRTDISNALSGRRKSVGGFKWVSKYDYKKTNEEKEVFESSDDLINIVEDSLMYLKDDGFEIEHRVETYSLDKKALPCNFFTITKSDRSEFNIDISKDLVELKSQLGNTYRMGVIVKNGGGGVIYAQSSSSFSLSGIDNGLKKALIPTKAQRGPGKDITNYQTLVKSVTLVISKDHNPYIT